MYVFYSTFSLDLNGVRHKKDALLGIKNPETACNNNNSVLFSIIGNRENYISQFCGE